MAFKIVVANAMAMLEKQQVQQIVLLFRFKRKSKSSLQTLHKLLTKSCHLLILWYYKCKESYEEYQEITHVFKFYPVQSDHFEKCILSKEEKKQRYWKKMIIKLLDQAQPDYDVLGTSHEFPLKVLTSGTSRGPSGDS